MRIAFALLAGYFLGRRRKLRMAAALAAAGLAGRARGGKGVAGGVGLLSQGIKGLTSSADVAPIVDRLRGDLLNVGKAAAVAAAGRQIDSLSDKLHERAEALRSPGEQPGDDADQADAPEDAQDAQNAQDAQDAQDSRDEPEDDAAEDQGQEPEDRERPQRRPRVLRRTHRAVRGSTHG
ncbi:hypothetical protein FXF51_50885 [Nonomuraea sp. PA05]|nr:hypothetical protein FXF51_50885 [Nonomuraea sp. PA05]